MNVGSTDSTREDSLLDWHPPVALASLSGRSDADWARAGSPWAGAAFLGGIAIDDDTRTAARSMIERDRTEFLPPDPIAFGKDQLAALRDVPIVSGINVRTTTLEPLARMARVCADEGAILEINAHCRQDEMCKMGAGEALLRESSRLCEQVRTAARYAPAVSVKVRAEVSDVDLPALSQDLEAAGADLIHIDAMDTESVVADVVSATENLLVVANNGVRDHESVAEYRAYGADAVSVGRPSDDPAVLESVARASIAEWSDWRGRTRQTKTLPGED